MREFLLRLRAPTIWAPGAIPDDPAERKYAAPLKRVFLPLFDAIVVAAGVFAVFRGIPSFEALLAPIAFALSVGFAVTGVVCFIGIAYPRLPVMEAIGKCILIGYLVVYGAALFIRDVPFTGCLMFAATAIALFRLWIIGVESGKRRDDAEAAAARVES